MKQSETPDLFFETYGFRQKLEMLCPESKDPMYFEGLEARYVNRLQRQVEEAEKYIQTLMSKIEWLTNQEFYKWKYRDQTDAPKAKP